MREGGRDLCEVDDATEQWIEMIHHLCKAQHARIQHLCSSLFSPTVDRWRSMLSAGFGVRCWMFGVRGSWGLRPGLGFRV